MSQSSDTPATTVADLRARATARRSTLSALALEAAADEQAARIERDRLASELAALDDLLAELGGEPSEDDRAQPAPSTLAAVAENQPAGEQPPTEVTVEPDGQDDGADGTHAQRAARLRAVLRREDD